MMDIRTQGLRTYLRLVWLAILLLALSACDGGAAASVPRTTPAPTTPATAGASPGSSPTPAATIDVIDVSRVDACSLLDEPTVRALTGLSDVKLHVVDQPLDNQCFWGVSDPKVPQWVEIAVLQRPDGLDPYTLTIGEGCTIVPVAGVGAQSSGGICTTAQTKVYLFAWDRGVAVVVLVNAPPPALTPADLAGTAAALLDDLGIP